MIRANRTTWLLATAAVSLAYAAPASAQATRTWISGVGDDVNPCSRTAPCKTFAGAISKTAAGGEIDCLDPGGFGTVTITKSITFDCSGTLGSILNSGTNGVNINDSGAGTIDVVIRGVSINGAATGQTGINFISGHSVTLENLIIMGNRGSSSQIGVKFGPTAATASTAFLVMHNVTVGLNGGGVLIQPGTGVTARADLNDVRVIDNTGFGVRVDGTISAAGITVAANNVQISGNVVQGLNARTTGANPVGVTLDNSTVSNNGVGISSSGGSGVVVRVGDTTITGNATGVSPGAGAPVNSYGDNRLDGNTTDGAFTGAVAKH